MRTGLEFGNERLTLGVLSPENKPLAIRGNAESANAALTMGDNLRRADRLPGGLINFNGANPLIEEFVVQVLPVGKENSSIRSPAQSRL